MKITILAIALALAAPVNAMTFWVNGVLFGTVCRAGYLYTIYNTQNAQPVGSVCPVRDAYGVIIATGIVTTE